MPPQFAVFCFLLSLNTLISQAQHTSFLAKNEINTLKESLIPLNDKILTADDSLNELQPIYELARNKSIVAIGEATHGTDEIRLFQLMLAKGLVSKTNFKAIALGETPLLDSYSFFDFVVNGSGDINKIANLFHFDVRSLLLWLRTFNENKAFRDKVWMLGSGVDTPQKTYDFIETHCRYYQLYSALPYLNNLKSLLKENTLTKPHVTDSLNKNIQTLSTILNASKGQTDSLNFKIDCMLRSLRISGKTFTNLNNSLEFFRQRDAIISENLEWMYSTKGKTAIILAHNFHVNKKTIEQESYSYSSRSFGEYLSEKYDRGYVSIGTEIAKGQFLSGTFNREKIIENKHKLGSIIGDLTPHKFLFFLMNDSLKTILNKPEIKISKGTAKTFLADGKGMIGDAFDGLIYIRTSTPYTFYNKEEFCTLFVNLGEEIKNKILKDRKLTLSAQFETSATTQKNQLSYSIYLNDADKKVIKHYTSPLPANQSAIEIYIPESTKYISISLILKSLSHFNLKALKANESTINLKNIELFDWNNMGYQLKRTKNAIQVIR
ncbi:erythromycin esterase family protein [Emticicia sp. TH156]|uniref:erythromycin esterase family protein n=1 Tax=Emticicia sp. TH156 TaxID=2067454 RepID=UPI000C75A376|nr:erythromycin esterase family protein [Emticicia sp. TH156]PLK44356.1 hypothetical protein C0V77_11235 [Emticicia sp. TH156]